MTIMQLEAENELATYCRLRARSYSPFMPTETALHQIEQLACSSRQGDNARALLFSLEGSALGAIGAEDISLHPYTQSISFYWVVGGEWDEIQVDVFEDHFESYLSRDGEIRIKHWPSDVPPDALSELVVELWAGMA